VNVEDFIAGFPDGLLVPSLLVKLAEYYVGPVGFLPGMVELTTRGRRQAIAWFDGDEEAARPFIVFAHDKSHAPFGYWRYEGQALDQAPLVYLDEEDDDASMVIASTLEEFLALLALGNPAHTQDREEGEAVDEYTARYRAWLRQETGIGVPTVAEARRILERAQATHPNLPDWIARQVEAHDV